MNLQSRAYGLILCCREGELIDFPINIQAQQASGCIEIGESETDREGERKKKDEEKKTDI